jgi:hypothetical protein
MLVTETKEEKKQNRTKFLEIEFFETRMIFVESKTPSFILAAPSLVAGAGTCGAVDP